MTSKDNPRRMGDGDGRVGINQLVTGSADRGGSRKRKGG